VLADCESRLILFARVLIIYIYIYILLLHATHPSLWLILNYSPQIKKKSKNLYIYIYIFWRYIHIYRSICIRLAAANNNAPVIFFSFFLYHYLLHLSLWILCRGIRSRISDRVYFASPGVTILCVSVKRERLNIMERMIGKYYTLPFTT